MRNIVIELLAEIGATDVCPNCGNAEVEIQGSSALGIMSLRCPKCHRYSQLQTARDRLVSACQGLEILASSGSPVPDMAGEYQKIVSAMWAISGDHGYAQFELVYAGDADGWDDENDLPF